MASASEMSKRAKTFDELLPKVLQNQGFRRVRSRIHNKNLLISGGPSGANAVVRSGLFDPKDRTAVLSRLELQL